MKTLLVPHRLALAFATAVLVTSSSAATSAFTIGPNGWSGSTGSFVVGYEFSISTTISITHLGITDWYSNGISGTPQVGVWKADGTSLTSITVSSGTAADLVETQSNPNVTYYLEQLTTALVLGPGNYVIANQHTQVNGSQIFGWNGTVTFAPEISYVKGLAENNGGASLAFPNDIVYTAGTAYIGPQFKYDVVPEPASTVMFLCGALGIVARRRRA